MASFDFNKLFETGTKTLQSYWDRQLFKSNPAAASAYYRSLSAQQGIPVASEPSAGGRWSNPAAAGTFPWMPVIAGAGVVAAVVAFTRK